MRWSPGTHPVVSLAITWLFAIALLTAPLAAEAQSAEKVYRIGILDQLLRNTGFAEFRQGLRDLGYVDGRNIIIEYRSSEGKSERLPTLAADLVRTKVDLIYAVAGSGQAAKNATTTIPIVFAFESDPVTAGLVASL